MAEIRFKKRDGELTVYLNGRIDALNADEIRDRVNAEKDGAESAVLDCSGVEYISSAGLRLILQLKKELVNVRLIRVSPEVYDVLKLTGFTDMMNIHVGCRKVSLEGCEQIGERGGRPVYRLDDENIVCVYRGEDALEDIRREQEAAMAAGDPDQIAHEIVRLADDSYGAVYDR